MKRIIHKLSVLVVMMVLVCSSVTSQQGNKLNGTDHDLVGKAMGAFRSNCHYEGPLNAGVTTMGSCTAGGFITRVTFFPKLNCRVVDCDVVRVAPVGYVQFDCAYNIMEVHCANAVGPGGTESTGPSKIK